MKMKKIISFLLAVCMLMSMAVCFADPATGASGFVSAMTDGSTGITGENLWTSITPFVGLFVVLFIFAFAYGRIRKSTKSGSKGKFNM